MKTTNELTNIKAFFTERRQRCLSVNALEKEAGIPDKTLAHFIKGRRMLSGEHLEKLIPVLVDFGYKPLTDNFLQVTHNGLQIGDVADFEALNRL